MKILVVDDDIMILKSISHCLESMHLDVAVAQNSAQALDEIENSKPNLIICDIMMPGFSGLGLLSLLKNFYLVNIPVIIVSSLNTADIISSIKELGAVDFIPKPIDFSSLIKHVKRHLGLAE